MTNGLFTSRSRIAQIRSWSGALIRSGIHARLFNAKPIWAQLRITERCNLQCAYCSEHTPGGRHVAGDTVVQWLKHCAHLGVKHVEFIGGEPLLHPDLARLMATARELGMNSGITTNGFLLERRRLEELMAAGLRRLQVSIDSIEPGRSSKKALSLLAPKLALLRDLDIWMHVNSVVTEETLPQARDLAQALFTMRIPVAFSPAHDRGRLVTGTASGPLIAFLDWLAEKKANGCPVNMPNFLIDYYRNLLSGKPVRWTCVGGCKAFYVDAEGRFCLCSHRPTEIPFEKVDRSVLGGNHRRAKGCEGTCGVGCMIVNSIPFSRPCDVIMADVLRRGRPRRYGTGEYSVGKQQPLQGVAVALPQAKG